MELTGKKVFVGLSGGVDSATTAALLVASGANVVGVFIKGWYPPGMPCTWAEDRRDAMRVAAHLRIPFVTLDASKEYKQAVIDYLLAEYAAGRTPNPDIMCNREVKFGAFHRYAKAHGADYIATGHYARTRAGEPVLMRGMDEGKDQSYFLWAVPKEALTDTLFPLGDLHKEEVRALAEKFDLPVAKKKDSQGICFLGTISVDEFLRREIGTKKGSVLDEEGNELGTHDGAVLHTLGERMSLPEAVAGPWYVAAKDLAKNVIVVSRSRAGGSSEALTLTEENWLQEPTNKTYEAQYRYHGPRIEGTYEKSRFTPSASLPEPAAPGQSLVLYDGDTVIGGGIIS